MDDLPILAEIAVLEMELRAVQVSLANLQPQLVEATNAAELATLDLKRLIDVPLDQPVSLVTPLTSPVATADSLQNAAEALSRVTNAWRAPKRLTGAR